MTKQPRPRPDSPNQPNPSPSQVPHDPDEGDTDPRILPPEPGPAPVPVRPSRALPAAVDGVITDLDLTTYEGKQLAFAAMNPADLEIPADTGALHVYAVHFVVFPDEKTDEDTGELRQYTQTVFIDAEGRTFRTSSPHAPGKVAAAFKWFTPQEWSKGIHFVVRERRSRREKRTYHDIRLGPREGG